MKTRHLGTFEIRGTQFRLTLRGDGTLDLVSLRPYDETEYHWAVKHPGSGWDVYRNGRRVTTLSRERGKTLEPAAVAEQLLNLDAAAHLKPTRAIW